MPPDLGEEYEISPSLPRYMLQDNITVSCSSDVILSAPSVTLTCLGKNTWSDLDLPCAAAAITPSDSTTVTAENIVTVTPAVQDTPTTQAVPHISTTQIMHTTPETSTDKTAHTTTDMLPLTAVSQQKAPILPTVYPPDSNINDYQPSYVPWLVGVLLAFMLIFVALLGILSVFYSSAQKGGSSSSVLVEMS